MAARPIRLLAFAALAIVGSGAVYGASRVRVNWIAERPLLPTRFDHKFHTTVPCATCHHNFFDRSLGPKGCLACHKDWGTTEGRRIDIMFHDFCMSCHRELAAAGKKSGPVKSCKACHVEPGAPAAGSGGFFRMN